MSTFFVHVRCYDDEELNPRSSVIKSSQYLRNFDNQIVILSNA